MQYSALIQGFLVGASLIIAIGPQNALLLNQGLKRQHVFFTAFVCSLTDCVLIALGVLGLGAIFAEHPLLIEIARWFGAIFLIVYGFLAFKSALHPKALQQSALEQPPVSKKKMLLLLLAVGFLNPHAYLDTVVLIGSISAQYPGTGRLMFGLGTLCASFVWFFSIGYGARVLTPLFKKPAAWRILDVLIGCVMWGIALSLW
ncbi:MAG: LysE/ArgO family amino acid transporter [Gammaproteobacteria bacterium]|nr:LysE/ArgO family amino acid transporter [Gammaproteobacteria bacterium]